jgi:rhamnulose-1-phosphate aldolase
LNTFDDLLQEIVKTAHDLWLRGWAERNAGNISVRLSETQLERRFAEDAGWCDTGIALTDLAGRHFLFTGSGQHMRNVERDPQGTLGVVQLDDEGKRYRTVWGFSRGCLPASELPAHLRIHATRKTDHAVIHTHPTNIVALTCALDLDAASLTRLLWEMHPECLVVFPDGCGFIEFEIPGSDELARATAEVLKTRRMTVWQHHGIVAAGPDLDTAFGLIDTAEKAAEIYLKAASLGPVRHRLSTDQLKALAKRFNLKTDLLEDYGGDR